MLVKSVKYISKISQLLQSLILMCVCPPPPQESPIVAISLTDSPGYLVSSKNTCLLQAGKAKPLNDAAAVALLKSGGWGGSLGVCFAVGVRVCVRQCAGK